MREAIAGIIVYFLILGKENPADVLTKFLPHCIWWPLIKPLLHWLSPEKGETEKHQVEGGVDN